MTLYLKRAAPKAVRTRLRPYYRALTRRMRTPTLIARDWSLGPDSQGEHNPQLLEAVLAGTLDLQIAGERVNVLLCAQPKSAGLYLTQLLASCLDLTNHQIGFDRQGGSIYYPRLLAAKFANTHTISHCHAPPTPTVLKMLRVLDLRPVVLTRNLLDSLVSRRDMLVRDAWAPEILSKTAVKAFLRADEERQIDVIITLYADRYINFFAGWDQLRGDRSIDPFYISYAELIENEVGLVSRVGESLDLPVSRERVISVSRQIREAGGINYSTGQQGRGLRLMTNRQIENLKQKARLLGCSNVEFLGFEVD